MLNSKGKSDAGPQGPAAKRFADAHPTAHVVSTIYKEFLMQLSGLSARLGEMFGSVPALPTVSRFAAIAGTAATLSFAPAAQALVVVSPVSNLPIPVTTSGVYINVVTGANSTSPITGYDLNPWGAGSLFVYGNTGGGVVTTGAGVAALAAGSVVGPASTFAVGPSAATTANGWVLNANNYFGFSFVNEATSALHYGYGIINVGSAFNAAGRSVVSLYYESVAGASITIPAIPEPSSYALMFGGLAAVGALARRRLQKQA